MFSRLAAACIIFKQRHGAEQLRAVLLPYMRPAKRFDLSLVINTEAAVRALAEADRSRMGDKCPPDGWCA